MPPKKAAGKGRKPTAAQLEEQRQLEAVQAREQAKAEQVIEDKLYQLNVRKVQGQWREIMKKAKTAELRRELEILQNMHEHHMDRKAAAAASLSADLKAADQQFQGALTAHLKNMETLMEFAQQRAATMQTLFEHDLATLNSEFQVERNTIQAQHTREKHMLTGVLHKMEYEFLEAETDARHEFSSFRDDVKNKNLEEKHALRIQLEGMVEDLWRQFQAALNQYNASTEERKKQFEDLKQKDLRTAKEIELQIRKLVRLQETIAQLKSKLANSTRDYEERVRSVREEKEMNNEQFQELKQQMNFTRAANRDQLAALAVESANAIGVLKSREKLAERILHVYEMNTKLETADEQVLFSEILPQSNGDLKALLSEQDLKELAVLEEELAASIPETAPAGQADPTSTDINALSNFLRQFNKVLLDKVSLEHHKAELLSENQVLRNVLKEYLNGVAVNETVLSQKNTLFIVNGRTTAPIIAESHKQQITAVDGPQHVTATRAALSN